MSRLGEAILVGCIIVATGIYVGQHVRCVNLWPISSSMCVVN